MAASRIRCSSVSSGASARIGGRNGVACNAGSMSEGSIGFRRCGFSADTMTLQDGTGGRRRSRHVVARHSVSDDPQLVMVMSIRSPALTPSMFFLSSTIRVTVRPSAVVTVIEGTAGSTALTVTVALSWTATVPAGSFVFARSNAASKLAPPPF